MTRHYRSQKQLAVDLELDQDALRLMQQARDMFGVEELNEKTALEAAKTVRKQLAGADKEVRLITQAKLFALMDDLAGLRDRLRQEHSAVGVKIQRQSQNKNANLAYLKGAM